MSNTQNWAQILYEIAMSIGDSLNARKMLKTSLSMILRKLNCSAGGVYWVREDGQGKFAPIQVFSIPRSTANLVTYNRALESICGEMDHEQWGKLRETFPLQGEDSSDYYCILELPDVGFMILVRSSLDFDSNILHSLKPLQSKLANAYIACLQNEELENSQEILEKRVEHRTREIKIAYEKLQQTQTQLLQSEKLAGIGQLAAGVAHEINNPVGFIKSNLGTLGEYVQVLDRVLELYCSLSGLIRAGKNIEDKDVLGVFSEIDEIDREEDLAFIKEDMGSLIAESGEGAQRVKEIVQNLKSFARLDESELKEADINEGIEATLKVVWNELKYKTDVHKKLGPLPSIRCYPGQLNQVFMNLLVNAAQAIPERGEITIETEAIRDEIIIRFTDNGVGIPGENLPKLFDPFFTTKEVGKGTGLGLAISYGIIKKHNGSIDVKSEVGKGTTFTVTLPLDETES